MNIIVVSSSGHVSTRPDTTWERDNENLYLPEFVRQISLSPVIYARICKSGRSVGEKFAGRYFDDTGFGVLLYPDDLDDGTAEGYAQTLCLDHTTFMTLPALGERPFNGGKFQVSVDDKQIYGAADFDKETIVKAISEVTKYIYIRTGDILAIELAPKTQITLESQGTLIFGTFDDEVTTDFKIII